MRALLMTALLAVSLVGCATTRSVKSATDANYAETVKGMTGVVLFSADWCPACKKFKPVWEKVTAEYADKLDFVYVDIDKVEDLSYFDMIEFIPTTVVYVNGVPVAAPNARWEADLRDMLDRILVVKAKLDSTGL